MFKVLAATILKKAAEQADVCEHHRLARVELESLFQDDFAAHAMIVKSRKAARAAEARFA